MQRIRERIKHLESGKKLPTIWELYIVSSCTAFAEVFVFINIKNSLLFIEIDHSEYERQESSFTKTGYQISSKKSSTYSSTEKNKGTERQSPRSTDLNS